MPFFELELILFCFSQIPKPIANSAEALRENEVMDTRYFYCLVIVSSFAAVTGIGFVIVLYFLLRKQSTAKAPITRAPSESAYDNPTYKVLHFRNFISKNK
jgi:hypothetical protein